MTAIVPPDPYKILGVSQDADAGIIKTAYRKLVLKCHPDKVTDPALKDQKQKEFQEVQESYETLIDADKRQIYDLEVKARKLREERDRAIPKSATATARPDDVHIHTARHPSEHRSSRFTTSKTAPSRPYGDAYASKSWENTIPRSRSYYEDARRARRTVSDERLRRDDSREDVRRREEERKFKAKREREREARERELRERDAKDRERRREAARAAKEREERERELKAQKKVAKERADREREQRRRQEADDKDRARSKPKPYVEVYPDEDPQDEGRSRRSKRSPKKDGGSSRDKSSSKRERRPSPGSSDEPPMPPLDTTSIYQSKMIYAAQYIKNSLPQHSSAQSSPVFSSEYQDPHKVFHPKRRGSGDGKHAKGSEPPPPPVDSSSSIPIPKDVDPEVSPARDPTVPPRLKKSYTEPPGHMHMHTEAAAAAAAAAAPPPPSPPPPSGRVPLSRAATMEPEFAPRVGGGGKYSSSHYRGHRRPSVDDYHHHAAAAYDVDDKYFSPSQPRVQRFTVRQGKARVQAGPPPPPESRYDPAAMYAAPPTGGGGGGGGFAKVKMSSPYGLDNIATSRRYGDEDVQTSSYAQTSPVMAEYMGSTY